MTNITRLPRNNYPLKPLATFNEGNSILAEDDGCYVLYNFTGEKWVLSSHIFPEALSHLRNLPEL